MDGREVNGDILNIRKPIPEDRPAILSVLTAAFGCDDEAGLVEKLWAVDAIAAEFVAEINSEVIGYCAFSEVTANPAINGLLLGLAPVAVSPAHQKQGAGKALVERGIDACRTLDAAMVVVLGHPSYYAYFGFEPASKFKVTWSERDAGDAFRLIDYAGATGAIAHKIDYHPAFSES